jgi:hypothetical protein
MFPLLPPWTGEHAMGILVQVLMNRHVLNDGSKAQCDLAPNIWRTIAIVIEGIQIARLGYPYITSPWLGKSEMAI